MSDCECPAAGFCPRYQRTMGDYPWQVCQGTAEIAPDKAAKYRENWASLLLTQGPPELVGDALTAVLASYKITDDPTSGCGCKELAAQMNQWRIAGCLQRRGEITDKLRANAKKRKWWGTLTAFAEFVGLDPIGNVFDQAIERTNAAGAIAPIALTRIDSLPYTNAYNCSLLFRDGRRFLFYRGDTKRPRVVVVEIDSDWQPLGQSRELCLPFNKETAARGGMHEDPRVVHHAGKVFISYAGYDTAMHGSVLLAELDNDFNVVRNIIPCYSDRAANEKNWAWFSSGGSLHCVYKSAPEHRVLRLEGDRLTQVASYRWQPEWTYGELRGGASPVLHNGEWWHFFHGTLDRKPGKRLYSVGLYTFCPETFRPLRWIPRPLLLPKKHEAPGSAPECVFPCGAVFENGQWHVSYGYFDKWSMVATWKMEDLERALVKV